MSSSARPSLVTSRSIMVCAVKIVIVPVMLLEILSCATITSAHRNSPVMPSETSPILEEVPRSRDVEAEIILDDHQLRETVYETELEDKALEQKTFRNTLVKDTEEKDAVNAERKVGKGVRTDRRNCGNDHRRDANREKNSTRSDADDVADEARDMTRGDQGSRIDRARRRGKGKGRRNKARGEADVESHEPEKLRI